jgi:hypothetical protein
MHGVLALLDPRLKHHKYIFSAPSCAGAWNGRYEEEEARSLPKGKPGSRELIEFDDDR